MRKGYSNDVIEKVDDFSCDQEDKAGDFSGRRRVLFLDDDNEPQDSNSRHANQARYAL